MDNIQALSKHLNCSEEEIIIKEEHLFEYNGVLYEVYDDYDVDLELYKRGEQLFAEELLSVPEHLRD